MLLEEARNLLLKETPILAASRVPLADSFGRVLAEEIISDMDFPPFNRSPLDGYAVKIADILPATQDNPVLLTQTDYIPAGVLSNKIVNAGEAARIMTGAPLPDGADSVVRLEDTSIINGKIAVYTAEKAAANICSCGEEIALKEKVLTSGTVMNEGVLGLLAMLGKVSPLVYKKPKIGILATGSELVAANAPLAPGKIRDTNSYMLAGKVQKCGGQSVLLGLVPDDLAAISQKLCEEPRLPMYLTTGGASVGDYDLMEQLFHELNVPLLFNRIAIKPGMPVLAGIWNGSLLIALSGNPAASSVSFEVLVRPLIKKMAGFSCWEHTKAVVTLSSSFDKPSLTRRFVWARWYTNHGKIYAEPLTYQGNGMLKSSVSANALLDIPPNSPPLTKGMELEAILL